MMSKTRTIAKKLAINMANWRIDMAMASLLKQPIAIWSRALAVTLIARMSMAIY